VVIKGSEIIKHWKQVTDDLWTVGLPNSFFGDFNPYADPIHGDFLFPNKQNQHTGQVYLDGNPLVEAASWDELDQSPDKPFWFAEVKNEVTTLWGRFQGVDPNEQTVEINVRQSIFYPSRERVNYITVRGFEMSQAATNWAPPTAEQIGLIGTHWSKGWIIENNTISHSRCVGVTLGKYGDQYDNTYQQNSQAYTSCIDRALQYGWNKQSIGHHRVCDNEIFDCGQAGIVGGMGAVFSTIDGNSIHDIAMNQRFSGYETAGIKFHAPVDTVIGHNHIYRSIQGIWLDWMTQGTVVRGNLLHDNSQQDLFVEVNHGPIVVCNNLFLSPVAIFEASSGGAYAHNLFAGRIKQRKETRRTPVFKNHSLDFVRLDSIRNGDERFYNNLFIAQGLDCYDDRQSIWMRGNVFLNGGKPSVHEEGPLVDEDFDPRLKLSKKPDGWYLEITLDKIWAEKEKRPLVTTDLLGRALTPDVPFENPDGTPLQIDTDYFGKPRDGNNPFPGPFENRDSWPRTIKLWSGK
jgi:alpha-N-arabinofuranosidase